MRRLVAGLMLVAAVTLGAEGCEMGDLQDLIRRHEITVHNESERTVLLKVTVKDVRRVTTLSPGASDFVTSLAGGGFAVVAIEADPYIAHMRARRDALIAELTAPGLSSDARRQLWLRLRDMRGEISALEEGQAALGFCQGRLAPGPDGKGDAVTATIVYTASALQLDVRCTR